MNDDSSEFRGFFGYVGRFVEKTGRISAYANGILFIAIITQVILRYGVGQNYVAIDELQWHLWALAYLFGISYCTVGDKQIRMDLLHRRYSPKTKEWLNLFSMIILVLPFAVVMFWHSSLFFLKALSIGEMSGSPGGLPYRWVIKSVLALSFLFLGLSALASSAQSIHRLRKG